MGRLIKLGDRSEASRVRDMPGAFAAMEPPAQSAAETEAAALRRELDAAAKQLRQKDAIIDRLQADIPKAYGDGEASGREAGRKEADQEVARRLAILSAGVERAVSAYLGEVAALEELAPLLALEGLGRVLGDPANHADLVRATIAHHLRDLDPKTVVRIEVSSDDFPPTIDLADLATQFARPGVEVAVSEQLASGGCRIKLTLGGYDIGIGRQWLRLRETLTSLPRDAGAP